MTDQDYLAALLTLNAELSTLVEQGQGRRRSGAGAAHRLYRHCDLRPFVRPDA